MIEHDEIDFDVVYMNLSKAIPNKEPMWYALHVHGVWCKGKRGRCYAGNKGACYKCKSYNGFGCN